MKLRLFFAAATIATAFAGTAHADFLRWSVVVEEDPFTNGNNITANYLTSIRSGVFLSCDSETKILTIKAVAGYAYEARLAPLTPTAEIMIDKVMVGSYQAQVGAFGDNIAGIVFDLRGVEVDTFLKAFIASKKQIAIKDGISDRPHLLRASGSTKAGQKLAACLSTTTTTAGKDPE